MFVNKVWKGMIIYMFRCKVVILVDNVILFSNKFLVFIFYFGVVIFIILSLVVGYLIID